MSEKHVQLEISNHKVAITVYVNGVNVFTNRYHQQEYKELQVNQWVTDGNNEFSANISINPNFLEELKDQSFDLSVNLYEGVYPDLKKTVLKELHWKYEENTKFPVTIAEHVTLSLPYGNWAWFDADILSDDTINHTSLKQFISSLYTALNNKDYGSLAPFLTTKATEFAAAYSIDLETRLQDQNVFFVNQLFTTSGWGLEPIDYDNLLLQYHADGKLVEVLTPKGKSPIQSFPMDENIHFNLPLFLCHKNNQWILCR